MSLNETAGEKTSQNIKYVKVNPASLAGPDETVTVWSAINDETGQELGFIASAPQPHEVKSGRVYAPVKWGFAIHKDEFLSGIQFPYATRKEATKWMLQGR